MAQFETPVVVPESIVSFFETFTGQGEIRFTPGQSKATFAFEAEDLWEAAQILGDIRSEINANLPLSHEFVNFEKPVQKRTPRPETEDSEEQPAKPKRKRRTKAEIEADRAAEAQKAEVEEEEPASDDPNPVITEKEPSASITENEPESPVTDEPTDEPTDDELDALLNM